MHEKQRNRKIEERRDGMTDEKAVYTHTHNEQQACETMKMPPTGKKDH